MRKILGLGCGVAVVLLCAAVAGLAAFVYRAGALEDYPPQSLVPHVTHAPAVWAQLDLESPDTRASLLSIVSASADWRTRFMMDSIPWRAALSVHSDLEAGVVRLDTLWSLRRLSGLVQSRSSLEVWRWFAGQKVESLALEAPGLWVVRSTLPIRDDARKQAAAHWPVAQPVEMPETENALLSFTIDNRSGGAYLALEPILNRPLQPGEEITGVPPALDAQALAVYFEKLQQVTGTASLEADGRVSVYLTVTARDEPAARTLRTLLERERDRAATWLEGYGAFLEGAWTLDGITVSGAFRVERAVSVARTVFQGGKS